MAVANSVNQIVIPGLASLVQSNLSSVLTSNSTIDAIRTNLINAGDPALATSAVAAASLAVDSLPSKEPLPTFASYSNFNNSPFWNIYDKDLNLYSAGQQHTDSELWSPWTGPNYTNNSISSNSWTTGWMAATPMTQADGHWYLRPSEGYGSYIAKNPDSGDAWFPYWGVVVGKEGVRQKISLYINGTTLRTMARGVYEGFYETIGISSGSYSTWANSNNNVWGSVGYNDRTRTLVIVEPRDGANNYRMHIWINQGVNRSLNEDNYKAGVLHNFLLEAKNGIGENGAAASYAYKDFQWQANSSQSYNESRYRMRVIVGDNGIIGMARFVPSNIVHYATYTPSTSTLNTSYNSVGVTTSYGIDNGARYGMRHQITWDNNWVASYAPYYYYGSGSATIFTNTKDPRQYFVHQWAGTTYGVQIVPYQKDKFIYNISDNADGTVGMRMYIADMGGYLDGRTYGGTISNGGTPPFLDNLWYGTHDTWYTSTNYPVLLSMPHWRMSV